MVSNSEFLAERRVKELEEKVEKVKNLERLRKED